MFMLRAPEFDASPLPPEQAAEVTTAFTHGIADQYPARTLVKAGAVKYHALHGGIYWRREPVKYIIMHSTETGIPVGAVNVINGWSSLGRRHPGAQYVVDRDGTIYQSVDPDLATVHINILKTLQGINNDNSIGIEINHTGSQHYPEVQLQSVVRLVTYLQDRYQVPSENIVTHRYAQRGDHTDPVRFDWTGFLNAKDKYRNQAVVFKMSSMAKQSESWGQYTEPVPNTYLQPHSAIEASSGTGPGAAHPPLRNGAAVPGVIPSLPGAASTGSGIVPRPSGLAPAVPGVAPAAPGGTSASGVGAAVPGVAPAAPGETSASGAGAAVPGVAPALPGVAPTTARPGAAGTKQVGIRR